MDNGMVCSYYIHGTSYFPVKYGLLWLEWTSVVLINGLFLLSTDVAPGLSLLSTHYLQQQPNYKAFHKDFFLVISITVETVKTLFLYIKLSFYFNNVSSVN